MWSPCVALSLLTGVASHGWMSDPVAIQPGAANIDLQDKYGGPGTKHYRDAASWFTNETLASDGKHPSSKPGSAQIIASCGVHLGEYGDTRCGTTVENMRNGEKHPWDRITTAKAKEPSFGEKRQCDARRYLANATRGAKWTAGGTARVAWSIQTNHQGAIGYRLCPFKTVTAHQDIGKAGTTEGCFQAGHLEFATGRTCIRCPGGNPKTDLCYKANDVTGAQGNIYRQWDNFLQGCPSGVSPHKYCTDPEKNTPCTVNGDPAFSLVDVVKVPSGLQGKYVLSFRWDCAHTTQVWQNCAIIDIVSASEAEEAEADVIV